MTQTCLPLHHAEKDSPNLKYMLATQGTDVKVPITGLRGHESRCPLQTMFLVSKNTASIPRRGWRWLELSDTKLPV